MTDQLGRGSFIFYRPASVNQSARACGKCYSLETATLLRGASKARLHLKTDSCGMYFLLLHAAARSQKKEFAWLHTSVWLKCRCVRSFRIQSSASSQFRDAVD